MTTVLTVDDSNSIRTIVGKALRDLGFEIEQAEDGEKALALLEETKVDLILLDVTMPVMDGPTMLKALRERGDKTPVIMLTSESKRSIVAGAMQLGIDDYMLKPFKPDELKAKVFKALGMREGQAVAANTAVAEVAAPTPRAPAPGPAGKQFVDVLIVDDMENVHKKLRTLLPPNLTVNGCVSARDALQQCQERVYRVVIIDMVIPDVNSVALLHQLRALQPHAAFVALVLRSANDPKAEITAAGFTDYLFKPFDGDAIAKLINDFFEQSSVLDVDGNILKVAAFDGKEEKVDGFYNQLRNSTREAVEKLAAACYDDAIFDLRTLPVRGDRTIRYLIDSEKAARKLGIGIRLVGGAEMASLLKKVTETAEMPFFDSVDGARAA